MMKELCAPSEPSLTALSDHFSPAQRCERERREGVRVLEVGHESMSIEEIICTETHCIALSYTVPRNQAQATLMASERGEEVKNEKDQASRQHWQHELRNLLNASPGVVRSLVRRHAPHCLRPTEEIEMAMVRDVRTTALEVELSVVDLALIDERMVHMPRRTLTAQVPFPQECTSAEAVEDAIFEMLQLDPTNYELKEGPPEMGI